MKLPSTLFTLLQPGALNLVVVSGGGLVLFPASIFLEIKNKNLLILRFFVV